MLIDRLDVYNNTIVKRQHTCDTTYYIRCHVKMYQYTNL